MEKKHLTRFFMLAVAAGTLFGACQKEDLAAVEDDFDMTGRIPLYAEKTSSASGAKLVADDTENPHKFKWYDGDQIKINGIANNVTVDHSSFAADALNGAPDNIIAVYPASICDNSTFSNAGSGSITVTIPHEIEYREGGIEVPMMAYTSKEDALANGLSFKHLASVLAVRVSNGTTNDIKMGSIEVSLGSGNYPIAGTWTVTYSGTGDGLGVINTPKNGISYDEGYSNKITMTFPTENPCVISSSESKYFFFPIFSIREAGGQSSSAKFTIKVRATDLEGNNACNFEKTQANNTRAIGRGEIAYAPVALDASTNSHAFKLGNGDDDYYEIATGNLVYNITAGTWDLLPYNVATVEKDNNLPATWFDPDQIDYEESSYSGTDPDGLMSLFFYGTADVEPNATPYYEWDERDITDYNTPLTTNDWGSVVAFREEGWTTPTSAQWKKLFNDSRNYYHYIPSQNGRVTLSDLNIEGYIVVPDISSFVEELRNAGKTTQVITGNQGLETLFIATNGALPNVTFATLQLHGARFIPFTKKIAFDGNSLALQPANGYANIYAAKDAKFFSIDLMDAAELESVNVPVRLIRKVGNN